MKLLVTAISLDFETDNNFYRVKPDEQIEIEQDVLGIWEVESEDDLVDKISDTIGWCVNWIDYQPNAPHSLTSFLQETQMRYKDQKTTIFSELANIMETDQFAMYDLLDVIIESLTPDQLNQIEDVIVNQYGEN